MKLKTLFFILIITYTETKSFGQVNKSYTKNFEPGKIKKIDGTEQAGILNFFPSHASILKFKESEESGVIKYSAEDLIGFQIGDDVFTSLDTLTVYGQLGIRRRLKNCFGQILDDGQISVYLIYFVAPASYGGSNVHYLNFWLIKRTTDKSKGIAIPYNQRLKEKKMQGIKLELKNFINDPRLFDTIAKMTRESGFSETVDIVKHYNSLNR